MDDVFVVIYGPDSGETLHGGPPERVVRGGFQNYREFEHSFRNGSQQGWRYGFSAQRASDSNSQGHRPVRTS